ncbi:Endoribonuclease XendoU-domain-containing protein, partial [Obelidium mucronatum]
MADLLVQLCGLFCGKPAQDQQQQQQQQYQQPQPHQQAYELQPPPPPQAPFLVSSGAKVAAPTAGELANLSAALARLWDLDANRCQPGTHFTLNLQNKTFVSNTADKAREPLFQNLDPAIFSHRPTYAKFIDLLKNFTAEGGVAESVSATRTRQEKEFIDLYLIAKNLAQADPTQFKQQLYQIWFELYKRVVKNDTSAFEHTFAGE